MNYNPSSTITPFPFKAYLALALGVVLLGFSGIFVKLANAPAPVMGFYRMAIGMIVVTIPTFHRLTVGKGWTRRAVWFGLLSGLFFSADLLLWNVSILLAGATVPTLMGNLAPLWVGMGAAWFLKEKLNKQFWFGLAVAIVGVIVIVGIKGWAVASWSWGILLGIGSGMFYAAYFLATQKSRESLDAFTAFWLAGVSSSAILLLVSLISGAKLTGYPPLTYWSFLGAGLLVQGGGQFLFSYALGYLPASLVAPAGLGQPVMTAIFAIPLLGESLTFVQLIGGIVVLLGIYLVQRSRN